MALISGRRRLEQIHVADAKGLRQFVKGNNCWVTAPGLKAAYVLLAESRNIAELLLRHTPLEPDSLEVLSD
jgi:hypothetical protein